MDGECQTIEGKFLFENLPTGKETIKITHPDYCSAMVNDIEVKEGETTAGVKVVLCKGGTVEGYVYDAKGTPQANVTLYFFDDPSKSFESEAIVP